MGKKSHKICLPQEYLVPWSKSYLDFWRLSQNLRTYGGTLDEVERGCLDGGGTLEDPALGLLVGESCDDWPLPFSFKDRTAVDFNLVLFYCDGFMTEYGFLMKDMMRDDDM